MIGTRTDVLEIYIYMWDTFAFFELILSQFSGVLNQSFGNTEKDEYGRGLLMAQFGFGLFAPSTRWQDDYTRFVRSRLDDDYLISHLTWFEEDAEAVSRFCCFAIGGLLAKVANGEIDQLGMRLGEAHLAGFNFDNDVRIGSQYREVIR